MKKQKKNIKQPFLDQESQQMIQMEDFSYAINPYAQEPHNYRTLEDQPNYGMIKKEIKEGIQQYILPSATIMKIPKQITMNGAVFRIQQPNKPVKKKKLPQMNVCCQWCNTYQKVPGNALLFDCFSCQQISVCTPTYGIFICGDCQANVCYPYQTSQLIKCTKCGTINKVPMHPIRKALKNKPKKKKKQQKYTYQQKISYNQQKNPYFQQKDPYNRQNKPINSQNPYYQQNTQARFYAQQEVEQKDQYPQKPRNSILDDYDLLQFDDQDDFPVLKNKANKNEINEYPIL